MVDLPASRKNRVLIDGFTLHAMSFPNMTREKYRSLTRSAQECLYTLIQSIILHDELCYIPEVIDIADRYPWSAITLTEVLRKYESDHRQFITSDVSANSERVRAAYNELKRSVPYEKALVDFVQKTFFDSPNEPSDDVLCIEDPALYGIFMAHQQLRTRAYNTIAYGMSVPYLVSPYRKKFCIDPSNSSTFAQDILDTYVGKIKSDKIDDINAEWKSLLIEVEVPPLLNYVFSKMGKDSLFEAALKVRESSEAKDFRAMCNQILSDDLDGVSKIKESLSEFVAEWSKSLPKSKSPHTPFNASISILNSINITIPIRNPLVGRGPKFGRKAHMFIYNIAKSGIVRRG